MRLLLLDPGLAQRSGHNAAMLEEFAVQAAATPGFTIVCAASWAVDRAAFADLPCEVISAFRVNGYSGFVSDTESHETLLQDLLATCLEDLARLDLAGIDGVLMPTAYPVHLAAVARWLAHTPAVRLACGLLMPPRFWAGNARAEVWLGDLMRDTLTALSVRPGTVLYSESSRYRLRATEFDTPMLLPPWADATLDWVRSRTTADARAMDRTLRFGFFGAPTVRKGVHPLLAVIGGGLPHATSIVFALPHGHETLAAQWNHPARGVGASTLPRGNRAYLAAMSEVDVVLAFYDPTAYADQMSGIVAEAIALGKPLLVADGCDAITGFLAAHAHGSFIALPFGEPGLREGIGIPAARWRECRRAAAAAAPGVQRLKHIGRYLATT
ncbi:hypothetical protein [Variovorax sp. PAMC 28711]|uniref:hypothetical protein n=1 Tax=Variovorax sp. PAMC 28711 TaxID=1795631 RepID=UPI00078D035B|nr:hypothetical protein [Variovorax sp. PAMC 28711]AMM25091.1 hypothetical protein AX767_12490 [Variovorax sp. PAMC 28711]